MFVVDAPRSIPTSSRPLPWALSCSQPSAFMLWLPSPSHCVPRRSPSAWHWAARPHLGCEAGAHRLPPRLARLTRDFATGQLVPLRREGHRPTRLPRAQPDRDAHDASRISAARRASRFRRTHRRSALDLEIHLVARNDSPNSSTREVIFPVSSILRSEDRASQER